MVVKLKEFQDREILAHGMTLSVVNFLKFDKLFSFSKVKFP